MKAYIPYIQDLERLLFCRRNEGAFAALADEALDGQASAKLAELVSTYQLKRTGAFFSSSSLSELAASSLNGPPARNQLWVADPACGAGNLLLAAARTMPVQRSLMGTLKQWGRQLAGFDLHNEFVRATHLRLALLALSRGAEYDLGTQLPSSLFPHIRVGDGLKEIIGLQPSHILVNPPFGPITASKKCSWGTGKVTKAAIFLEECLSALPAGTSVSAILPDVLRSGSRYEKWRITMEGCSTHLTVTPAGNFETADVDVFLLHLMTGIPASAQNNDFRWWQKKSSTDTLGNRFVVSVGAVVPHRLKPREGPIYPFLHAKGLPFWERFKPAEEKVSFAGTTVLPPFVAVRRTSSPSDRFRALGTIVCGTDPVAVENHLVVCKPRSGTIADCERLVQVLRLPETNEFLNDRIRCRHLTVGVVRDIPWIN